MQALGTDSGKKRPPWVGESILECAVTRGLLMQHTKSGGHGSPERHGVLSPQATGLHSNYNCVTLGGHCGWSTEAVRAAGMKLKWVLHVVP